MKKVVLKNRSRDNIYGNDSINYWKAEIQGLNTALDLKLRNITIRMNKITGVMQRIKLKNKETSNKMPVALKNMA